MGKHEAPSPNKKGSPRHAAPDSEKSGFSLSLPEIKRPKLPKMPEISLPKLYKQREVSPEELFKPDDSEESEAELPDETPDEDADMTRVWKVDPDEIRRAQAESEEAEDEEEDEEDENDEEEDEDDEEEEDDAPSSGRSFSLPKIDWSKLRDFFERVTEFGLPAGKASNRHTRSYAFDRDQVILTAGSALLFFILWLLPTRGALRFVLFLLPFFLLGAYTVLDAVGEVLDRVIPGRNLLISVSAVGMLCLGQPRAAVFVLLMHRVFILLEAYLYESREASLDRLCDLIPDKAVAEKEDGLQTVDPKSMAPGDILFVPAGEIVALDGVVVEGISTLDTSALCGTGEELNVGVNSQVFAGCRNAAKPLRVRVTRSYDESTAFRCVDRAKKAAATEPVRVDLLQNILAYVPMALAIAGVLVGLIVSIVTGAWRTWLYRGLLLIALGGCGDALLSARMAYFTGITNAIKDGISFLNADCVDSFAGSDMMIFSKTGSVTEGKYSVVAVYPVEYEEKDLLTIAALAECQSEHPIAVALREACGIEIHHRSDITLLEETPGRGIHALFGGRNIYVGNSTLLLDHNIVFDVPSHKGTVIHVAVDNKYAGCIVLNDRVRDGAFDAIEELRLRGIRATVMLTGDVRSMARPIASSLSFDMVKCELSNESKLEALNYLRESKGNSAAISYVSSKDEDLELLQAADVGVGFNALTQSGLIGGASVLVLSNQIFRIPQALFLAKRISFAALLDTAIMLGVELLLIILGLCGIVSVWAAMLLILLARVGTLVYSIYFK